MFTIFLGNLCFETILPILPDSGAYDGILWGNLPLLVTHTIPEWSPLKKQPSDQFRNCYGGSRLPAFKSLYFLSIQPLYSGDVSIFMYKCDLIGVTVGEIYHYEIRGRDNYRTVIISSKIRV